MKTLSKKLMSYLMAAITILSLMSLLAFSSSAASISIPKGAKEYKGHSYYVYKSTDSWEKAKKNCEKKGGHLATITSKKENAFVYNLMKKKNVVYAWLGATNTSGNWKWITGEKFKYTNWASNEPNNYYGDQHYIEMFYDGEWSDWAGTWYNTFDGDPGYICEWDMTKAESKKPMLNKDKATIYYGDTTTLKMLNTKSKTKWTSSNKKVANVSSKGKVTAKGLGTATITAKIGKKSYKCKVTVKDRNVSSAIGFVTNGGGYFIKGSSIARVTFRPKNYSCAKAVVTIKSAAGDTVLTKTYTNLKKNTNYTFTWDGKDSSGIDAYAGSYRVSVKIGNKISYSPYLAFRTVNEFGGGSGSAANPFKITATEQIAKIAKYPDAHFVQINDLDFGYSSVGNLFSEDQPFNGVYNGNGKTLKNILSNYPIFNYVSEKAVLQSINITDSSFNAYSALVNNNYGKITNCNVNATVTLTSSNIGNIYMGLICRYNNGIITNCSTKGTASATTGEYQKVSVVGGIVGSNDGKIISCISEVNTTASATNNYWGGVYSGGIAGANQASGFIQGCEASGTIKSGTKLGGIAGCNNGQILSSYYTGTQTISIAGDGSGVVA